ncbi:MAG: hypothetical protein HY606_09710 [Planctomycetes bacterium]|nr:hypothetical protein [Planctomycetota bacterium]
MMLGSDNYLIEMLRMLSPARKLEMVAEINNACRQMAMIGLRQRYPDASQEELRLRLAALWIDRNLMIKAFSWDPDKKGL